MMTIEEQQFLVTAGYWAILLGIPAITVLLPLAMPSWPKLIRSTTRGVILATAIGWLLLIFYRIFVEVPLNMDIAQGRGDMMYDGVGGNAATVVLGWLFALLCSLPHAILRLAIQQIRKRKKTKQGIEAIGNPHRGFLRPQRQRSE